MINQVKEKQVKIDNDLVFSTLLPYQYLDVSGDIGYDIPKFLVEHPDQEDWLSSVGVEKSQIEVAKDQICVIASGVSDVMFSRWHFTTDKAWEKFRNGEPYLRVRDFACAEYFKKYFIISLGLLEGNCIVHGKEGGGKSLWAYHIAYQVKELFGKRCTLKPKPKKGFGDFDTITDEQVETEIEYLKELTGKANDLTEDDEISDDIQDLLAKSKLYNRVYVCDESYQELEKTRQTNVTRQYGRLVRQHRHLHTLFIFISPDKRDIAGRLIFDRRSHEVQCAKYGGVCHYTVIWKNEGITKPMELNPKEWAWLWDSHNLVSGGSKLKVKL